MHTAKQPLESRGDIFWHKVLRRPYRLHVTDHGGDGPPILFLHGLASSSATWEHVLPLLRSQYRCITIDLIGFGQSPKPQWYAYSMDDHIRDIHAAIRRLRLGRPAILVGHSLGSLLATRYARLHQERVHRLVLISPPVYAPLGTIESRVARQRTSLYLRAYRFLRTHKRVTPENIIKLSRILPQMKFLTLNMATWIPFIRSLEQCIENQTVVQDIAEVRAPINIFYGIFDEVIVPYNIRQLAKLPDVTIHPLKVDHNVGKRYAAAIARQLIASQKL